MIAYYILASAALLPAHILDESIVTFVSQIEDQISVVRFYWNLVYHWPLFIN